MVPHSQHGALTPVPSLLSRNHFRARRFSELPRTSPPFLMFRACVVYGLQRAVHARAQSCEQLGCKSSTSPGRGYTYVP